MALWNKSSNSIRCSCGYCGADSTSGVWFIPKKKSQKYYNHKHYLKHQYNGVMPFKKICACGCNKKFYTIDISKNYIKGHQKNFRCCLCNIQIEKQDINIKRMNGGEFIFCGDCFSNIKNMGSSEL